MSFIDEIAQGAVRVGKKYGVFPSLIIAQACLESNFGRSGLAQKGKNLFGVKGEYNGQYVTMRTAEYNSRGQKYYINAKFAKYPSYEASLEHLGQLYANGVSWDRNHYKPVINAKTVQEAAQKVKECGYCTDPNYPQKLLSIIQKYNLTKYDGRSTVNATKKASVASASAKATVPYPGKVFKVTKPYMKGDDVKRIQNALNIALGKNVLKVDGIYGEETAKQVSAYQKRHGLKVDGMVGEQTWNTLF